MVHKQTDRWTSTDVHSYRLYTLYITIGLLSSGKYTAGAILVQPSFAILVAKQF